MSDVFISYPRQERAFADLIKQRLNALDISVFMDVEGIDGGVVFPSVISSALDSSKAVIACCSPLYFTRPWCLSEAYEGATRGILVPLIVEQFERTAPPVNLRNLNYLDLRDWRGTNDHEDWRRTVSTLSKLIGRTLPLDADQPASGPPNSAVLDEVPDRQAGDLAVYARTGVKIDHRFPDQREPEPQVEATSCLLVLERVGLSMVLSPILVFLDRKLVGVIRGRSSRHIVIPPGDHELQFGFNVRNTEELAISERFEFTSKAGKRLKIMLKFNFNMYGWPPLKVWSDENPLLVVQLPWPHGNGGQPRE